MGLIITLQFIFIIYLISENKKAKRNIATEPCKVKRSNNKKYTIMNEKQDNKREYIQACWDEIQKPRR